MCKFAVILLLAALLGCVHAEDEQPTKEAPQSASFLKTVLCYASPKPWDCVREQAGRMLNHWDQTIDEKKHNLMVEADEEMKESETSRGLSDEEKKQTPSQLISALDRGFSALANILTDEVDGLRGRDSRALNKAQSKQVDDDTNDFNDDYNVLDAFRAEAEGKLSEESRGKKGGKQTDTPSYQGPYGGGIINDDDDDGYGSLGYRGKGKKGKKGKKGLMKIFFFGAILKSKIELLLKVLSFHLQLKFFAVAVAGLIINLARLWIDLKNKPQKVIHVEHAQHQHHYEDHDDWGSSWKRQAESPQEGVFAHRLAYNNQYQQQQH